MTSRTISGQALGWSVGRAAEWKKRWVQALSVVHERSREGDRDKHMSTAQKVINALQSRGGFDGWWDDIDEETQEDIIAEISEIMSDIIDGVARGLGLRKVEAAQP